MPHSRRRKILTRAGWTVLGVLVVGALALVAWSQIGVMQAEPEPLESVTTDDRIVMEDTSGSIVLSPAEGPSDTGLVFIPGAKVDAAAYAANLAPLVAEQGMTVVITRPWLNLAFFDPRPLTAFTDQAPDVDTWLVGGHSLGGVRSCALATDADALVLFASYCAADLSGTDLPVLSIGGSEDGLSTPEKIRDAVDLLPANAEFVQIDGANHADFGAYGAQDGDGTSSIADAEMTAELTALITEFVATLP